MKQLLLSASVLALVAATMPAQALTCGPGPLQINNCPQGPQGPAGPQGAPGNNGQDGQGTPGANGRNADADAGIALAMAIAAPMVLSPDKSFAIGANIGFFESATGFAVTGILKITPDVHVNGGVGLTDDGSQVGGRAGVQFQW